MSWLLLANVDKRLNWPNKSIIEIATSKVSSAIFVKNGVISVNFWIIVIRSTMGYVRIAHWNTPVTRKLVLKWCKRHYKKRNACYRRNLKSLWSNVSTKTCKNSAMADLKTRHFKKSITKWAWKVLLVRPDECLTPSTRKIILILSLMHNKNNTYNHDQIISQLCS